MTLLAGVILVGLVLLWATNDAKNTLQEQAEIRKTTPANLQGAAGFVGCLWIIGFAVVIPVAFLIGLSAVAVWSGHPLW